MADLNGDGRQDFIFGNEALDRVSVEFSRPGQSFTQERTDGVLAPGAVSTADLNADGLPDLVIANSGANNVLAYLGVGAGQFGPVHSFFAGTNPAGLTTRDLNGDGLLDLVVANEGSNDVTILLGQVQGGEWTFTPGPRLRAGAAPVSTTVADVTGDGVPDLLVSNSQSNNVSLLRGVGGGFFNDQSPLVFDTGNSPQQSFVGNFDGAPGLDLVTVNAGSNDLSFFSNFISSLAVGTTIPSGGVGPVAAVGGDFNGDGLGDLLVAHNGDGVISLLLGQEGGPSLQGFRSLAELPHPTALALADLVAGRVAVYVAGEDSEVVRRLSFDFGPISLATAESQLPPGGGRGQIAELLPLQNSTVAIVAALPTIRRGDESLTAREALGDVDLLAIAPFLLGVAVDQAGDTMLDPAHGADPDSLLQFITGQEDALASRPPLSREDVLNGTGASAAKGPGLAAVRQLVDVQLPGVGDALDHFWQTAANGGSQALEVWTTSLRLATTPLRMAAPPDPGLQETLNGVVEELVKAARSAADLIGARFEGTEELNPTPSPLPEGQPESAAPESIQEGFAPAASLITALFLAGFRPPTPQESGRRRTHLPLTPDS